MRDRPKGRKGNKMNKDLEMRKKGYKVAKADIEEMGIEWTKHIFALRLKCTGLDAWFTIGYGEAIVEQSMRNKVILT